MGFLSFSCQKSYYYLLFYWILDLSIVIVRDLYLMDEISDQDIHKGTESVYISCLNIADLCAGLLVLRTYFKMKSIKNPKNKEIKGEEKPKRNKKNKKKKNNEILLSYELIYNDNSIKRNKYIYLLIISLLEFVARCTDLLYLFILKKSPIRPAEVNWLISIDTFARIIFSSLILKAKIYRHHKCSLLLIIIGLFSMSVCAFEALVDHELENWPYFLFIIGKYILFPLEDVINKILLTDQFLLPHYLMFYRGLFNLCMIAVSGFLIFFLGFVKFEYFTRIDNSFDMCIQILIKVIFTLFSFFKAFCLLKIIDIYSPQHVAFLNTAFSLYQLIKCRYKSRDSILLTTIDAIFLVVIIFANLVYNEMIILNFWGLNKDTKVGLLDKEREEIEDIKPVSTDEDYEDDEKEEENSHL